MTGTEASVADTRQYRALVCITTCRRLPLLRRYLPHFALLSVGDPRFAVVVSADGPEGGTAEFCTTWRVPLVHSDRREGVGVSKNRVLQRFPEFDYYFFIEDDVELVDAKAFPAHVEMFRASNIHHFSLFARDGIRKSTGTSIAAGLPVVHCEYGSASFSFFTRACLERVGGWHPRFAEYRRWGHTEHSYRVVRAGMAPAPFNVAVGLIDAFIWHWPPSVSHVAGVAIDRDQIAAPERALIDERLPYVPVQTLSPHHFNGVALGPLNDLASVLDAGERYPLAQGAERRQARAEYQLWRSQRAGPMSHRGAALASAVWNWPANPMLRHALKNTLSK